MDNVEEKSEFTVEPVGLDIWDASVVWLGAPLVPFTLEKENEEATLDISVGPGLRALELKENAFVAGALWGDEG